jgi:aspartate 1-decarboxylase
MIRTLLKSKIHRATVTDTDMHYDGSLGIDADLMAAADILPYEQVHVYNINNGERFETYAIEEAPGSGAIVLRGAAARKGVKGDLVIIATFAPVDEQESKDFKPAVISVDEANKKKEDT